MKCQVCNEKEATYFYEETVGGKSRSYHLCRDCAKKLQAEGKLSAAWAEEPYTALPDLFGDLFGLARARGEKPQQGKSCPDCGATWREIATAGKVCCPTCYETFREALAGSIRSMHGNVTHVGRAPLAFRAEAERKNKKSTLKAALKTAIETENFEEAARLRDELRALEGEKEA